MDNNVDGDTIADDYNQILQHLQNLNIPESAIEEATRKVDGDVIIAEPCDVLNPAAVHSDSVVSIAETQTAFDLLEGRDIYGLPLLMRDDEHDDERERDFMEDHQAQWKTLRFSIGIMTNTLVRY